MFNKKKAGGAALPNADVAGPSNVVNTTDNLVGLEDLAHGTDDHGIPFILVDGAVCTTRAGLDAALSQVERKRMEQVLKDIDDSDISQLKNTEPPPELDMNINLSAEAIAERNAEEEERKFRKDISDLTFWPSEEQDDDIGTTQNANTNMEEICQKLEQLRLSQEQILVEESVSGPKRPSIQRQATFDIKRRGKDDNDTGIEGTDSSKKDESSNPPQRDAIPHTEGIKHSVKTPESFKLSARAQEIANQIRDLLVELHQENKKVLSEGSSASYIVTLTKKAGGVQNCTLRPISSPKFRPNQPRNTPMKIFSPPNGTRSQAATNSTVIGKKHFAPALFTQASPVIYPEVRAKSPYLHRAPCSFLKVPAPAKYCHGRKRD